MVTAKKISRTMIRASNSVVDFLILTIILLLIAVAIYAIWDTEQIYQAADAKQYAVYKPTAQGDSISYQELRSINPEVFSWLTVYGTSIDYPVTQSNDNSKYVNTNAFGEYSLSGAIFLDYVNSPEFEDFNSILYGHHMEKQTMFGEIEAFGNKDFFDRHAYGNLYYNGVDHGLEFFAFLQTDAYDKGIFTPGIVNEAEQQAYLQYLWETATYTRDVVVHTTDHILLLTTCSSDSTNGRDILVAKITDESYDDHFAVEESSSTTKRVTVDRRVRVWEMFPSWQNILLLAIILFLFDLVRYYRLKNKHKQTKE